MTDAPGKLFSYRRGDAQMAGMYGRANMICRVLRGSGGEKIKIINGQSQARDRRCMPHGLISNGYSLVESPQPGGTKKHERNY